MGVFLCLVISVIVFIIIILVCKWSNFSIIPKGMRIKPPSKYKFPKVSRSEDYKWEAHYSSDESDNEDILFGNSDDSDNESSDDESSDDESSDDESSDNDTETVFF